MYRSKKAAKEGFLKSLEIINTLPNGGYWFCSAPVVHGKKGFSRGLKQVASAGRHGRLLQVPVLEEDFFDYLAAMNMEEVGFVELLGCEAKFFHE